MDYNDYELVSLAQANNEEAKNILYKKYKPLIENKARNIYRFVTSKGVELVDLIQEGNIGFEEAINNYKDSDVLFYTFANICITRQMNSVILKLNRAKYKILNEAISLDKDDDDMSLLDRITDNKNPEEDLINYETEKELYEKIRDGLTGFEQVVFELKLQGFEYKEIANILDKDGKAIDNALQRIRMKIKKIMNEEKK